MRGGTRRTLLALGLLAAAAGIGAPALAAAPTADLVLNEGGTSPIRTIGNPTDGAYVDLRVGNHSPDRVAARLVVDLPANWRAAMERRHLARVSCAPSGAQFVCELADLASGGERGVELRLFPARGDDVGTTSVAIHVEPVAATDPNPADNDAIVSVENSGTADLITTIVPSTRTPVPGEVFSYAVKLTNRGPDPAVSVGVLFQSIAGTGEAATLTGVTGGNRCVQGGAGNGPEFNCPVQLVGVGASVGWTVTARSGGAGVTRLVANYSTVSDDPDAHLRGSLPRVAVAQSPAVTVAADGPPDSRPPPLAVTGVDTAAVAAVGAALVALGALLVGGGATSARRGRL